MIVAAFASQGFRHDEHWSISLASSVSAGVFENLKLVLGTVLVPLITAYAVEKLDPARKLPRETSILLALFFFTVIAGAVMGGLYDTFMKQGLQRFEGPNEQVRFKQVPWDNAKESLTYVCLVLGIRLPKG